MKKLLPLVCVFGLLLSGCATYYTIVLSNGTHLTTKGKPKLEHGRYYFKDLEGKPGVISAGRVREIGPSSMIKSEGEFRVGPSSVR